MSPEEIRKRAEERMPDNAAEIVSSCQTAFKQFLLIGVIDDQTGAMFVHGDVRTETLASFVATLCRQDVTFLPQVLFKLNYQKMNSMNAEDLIKPDVLSDEVIFRDDNKE